MRYNAILSIATERSKNLFTLPSIHIALLFNIFAILLPYSWLYVLELRLLALEYAILASTFLIISFVMIWRSAPYFDIRRSLWSSFFVILPLVIGSFLEIVHIPFYSMIYTSIFLSSLISWSLGESIRSRISPVILSVIAPFMSEFPVNSFIFSAMALISTYLIRKIIGKISEPVLGLKDFDSVRALAEIVLSGSGQRLERSLEERGTKGLVKYDLIKLGDLALITADIHPGPFKMGSYNAPGRIVNSLSDKGVRSIFLRRACSHERNLSSSKYVDKLIDSIFKGLEEVGPCCVSTPIFAKTKNFELSAQRFGDILLFTVSGHPLGSFEDIPHEIEEIVSRELEINVSVIDRHDSLLPDRYEIAFPDTEIGRELVNGLMLLGRRVLAEKCYEKVEVGYAEDNPSWRSIGRGGVRVVSIKTRDWIISYLSIDGNNMVPKLRDELDAMAPEGVNLIVATTDTHEVLSTKVAYNPIGSECTDSICLKERASHLTELVRESLKSMIPVKAECYKGEEEVIFIGRDLMAMLSSLIKASEIAKYLIALSLIPQILILLGLCR